MTKEPSPVKAAKKPKFIPMYCDGIATYARQLPVTQEWICARCCKPVKVVW